MEILAAFAQTGVTVWAEGSRLRYRASKGVLTEEMRAQLAGHKEAILNAWRQQAAQNVAVHPATQSQRALWFLHQAMPEGAAYNVAISLRIRSSIQPAEFRYACQALVDRHPALRTTFGIEDDRLVQRIHGAMTVDLRVHGRAGVGPSQLEQEVIQRSRVPFDLIHGPLLRIDLYTCAPNDHILLIGIHHIAADGWSALLLLDDLRRLYPVECNDGTKPPPLPRSDLVAFARQQEEMLAGPEGRAHEVYWTQALAGKIPTLDLPTDRRRGSLFTDKGSAVAVDLGPELSAAVRAFAATNGTTPYVVLLAAYQVLLHRYTNQAVVIVGSPTYGRDRPEFDGVVGDLINMIPLKADFGADPSFGEFVTAMRQRVIEGIEHQDYPFPMLVERLQPERDLARTPIFQTVFILQKFKQLTGFEGIFSAANSNARVDFAGLVCEPYPIPQQEGQFDIALELVEFGGAYKGQFKYKTDLFDPATITRLVGHYENLLRAAVSAPRMPVSRLPLLDPVERKTLVEDFNATALDYPGGQTVVDLFAMQAVRRPEAVAVRHQGITLTYGQLADRSDRFARHLLERGMQPDSLVGLCLERNAELLVAILGILKAGGAYVPLDPGFPGERLTYMLEDCAAPLLVTESALEQRLFPGARVTVVNLDLDAGAIERQSPAPFSALARPENRAYVLYTSGSTGRPKGVEIEHRALTNLLTSMAREPGLGENDVLLAITTLSFDIAGLELFLPLVTGARIELAGRDNALDGVALARLLEESKATVMQATPVTWRMLFESGWDGNLQLKALCGGEAMGRDLAAQLLPACRELWNLYGPTETTIWSSIARVPSADDISIGRPIANTQMYILDAHREPVPVGVVGELWIGGHGLARGYLNRGALTTERFVANPFHPGRMYRTGDLARYRRDGCIDCLGRADAQVKIRGFRIEPGEIESVLGDHPAVTECAVAARELNGELRLVAYVVGSLSPEDCRQHLRNRLPEYMVPAIIVALSVLPKTPNHKIDRNALPPPDASATDRAREYVAPRSDNEKIIARVFAEVLHVPTVGSVDNFFELGGHSLLATRVMARLHQHFGIEIPLRILFEQPTTTGIGAYLDMVFWTREQASYSKESDDRITIEI